MMECKKCGVLNSDNAQFCVNCGYSFQEENNDNAANQKQATQFYQNRQYAPPYTYPPQPPQQQINVTMPNTDNEHVSTAGWVARLIVNSIPLVGFIMLFVWAFGGTPQKSLKNWARAQLLLNLIIVGLIILIYLIGLIIAASITHRF